MKIAHFGTFDVNNYGDLLFPHIAEWRIPEALWFHISPLGSKTIFKDSLEVISYREASNLIFDAAFIGGGNIVHMRSTNLIDYREVSGSAYASLWVGAAHLASQQNIPLIFNGPSISCVDLGLVERFVFKHILNNTQYAAFREKYSVQLAHSVSTINARLIPDTAFDISRMWPFPEFNAIQYCSKYFIVHVNSRYSKSVEGTAKAIDEMAIALKATARLMPIGPCHGDIQYANQVFSQMKTNAQVVGDMSLKGFAKEIAGAKAYVGSSMHGFITALSYDVPGILVLNDKPMNKFLGLLSLADLAEDAICDGWENAVHIINQGFVLSAEAKIDLNRLLDVHWQCVKDSLANPNGCKLPSKFRFWRWLLIPVSIERVLSRALSFFKKLASDK